MTGNVHYKNIKIGTKINLMIHLGLFQRATVVIIKTISGVQLGADLDQIFQKMLNGCGQMTIKIITKYSVDTDII